MQKQRTVRDAKYLKWLSGQSCCICFHPGPSDPHHILTGGIGTKGPDDKCVPVCHEHHMHIHLCGKKQFYRGRDLMPEAIKYRAVYESLRG